jgi:hypothetical protein
VSGERGWSRPGELPEFGVTYEWCDFVGATFVGALESYETADLGDGDGVGLVLHFADRSDFSTNLPVAFRPVAA